MANKIVIKKSSVAGKVPVAGDLDVGELGVNVTDAKLYTKNASGVIVQLGGGGAGDVTGPASSTDNALTRFDGTTGKVIQNSTATLDDNGNFQNVNSIGLDTTPATLPTSVGTMSWDDGDGVPSVILKGGNTTLQVGTQEYSRVYNDSGTTLTIGQVVYISGAQGNRVAVKLARADVEATSFGTIGLVAETIANGAEGFIIVSGALYKLNTNSFVAGTTVYLSPSTAGAITTTKPQAPDQLVVIGWVERVSATVGSIYIKIDNGYELDELHDVRVISPQSGNLLIYDATTTPIGVWKNANITAGSGISVTNGPGSVTVANAGVITFSGGTTGLTPASATTGAISLSGTLAIANGGTGQTTASTAFNALSPITATGDLIIGNGTNSATRLPIGANTFVLTSNGTTATWAAPSGGGGGTPPKAKLDTWMIGAM